VLFIFEVEA